MKYILLLVLILFASTDINAQISGGQIKRQSSSNMRQTNKQQKKSTTIGNGRNSEEDKYKKMSMSTLEKYAEKGDVMAAFYLGYNYAQNDEFTIAITWFRYAGGRGLVRAQLWLAYCYYHGKGCDKDWTLAKQWLDAAAKHGSEDAKEYLNTWFK